MMVMISVEEDGKRQGQDFRQVGMEKVEKPNGALELDYHYDDDDLYIMGAVCVSVCYVFSYFFFFTPPSPLCWENYFGR